MKLDELDPLIGESRYGYAQTLNFLCPNCRKRRIAIDIWNGPSTEVKVGENKVRLWHAEQGPLRDWRTLTVSPSVDHHHGNPTPERPCIGWHGFITNGQIT